jgi:predicted TIM-barrel fold metal-dependent hydrolase
MPLNTHGGSELVTTGIARYKGQGASKLKSFEVVRFGCRGLWWMILGGVFERHPGLRLVLTEQVSAASWLPLTLVELDELDEKGSNRLSKRPSEYFKSNCFIGASFMSNAEARTAVANDLTTNYLWGSDFPHMEGTYPWSVLSLRMMLEGITPEVSRRVIGANLIDVFQLDQIALQQVANRIGPTTDELETPLAEEEIPVEPGRAEFSGGFRRGRVWW